MDIAQDAGALLPAGDFDTLDKREKEALSALQEDAVAQLMKAANDYQTRFPGLRLEWRFQVEVYKSVKVNPGTVRYSGRVY